MEEKQRLGDAGFRDGATYERGRPDYPGAAMAFLAGGLGLRAGRKVLDLGAGTGKLTRLLGAYGVEVVAVEPSGSMRAEFVAQLPGVPILDGRGEAIPLPDGSVDVVLVAQAFHWFEPSAALREIARVLRTGGTLGLVWNERDESVDWVHRLSIAMRWAECRPYEVGMDFRPVLATGGHFHRIERRGFTHVQRVDRATLRERVASTSYIVTMDGEERASLMRDVDRVVETILEPIDLPYVTDAYVATRAS